MADDGPSVRIELETGCIIFLITHSYRQALRLADEVLFLKDGRLLERGAPQKVLEQPDDPEVSPFVPRD